MEEVSTLQEAPSSGLSATFSLDAGEKGPGEVVCTSGAGEKGRGEDVRDERVEHGERAGWLAPIPLEPKRQVVRTKKIIRYRRFP